MWITWPFFPKNLKPRSLTPRWPLTPKKGHCIHILWCIFVKVRHNDPWVESHMWPQQTWGQRSSWGQRSLTPRWPLTPSLLRSHVWFYPRIIVSNFDENTSKYVDTVTLFSKTWTKGHWPLDDIWPQDCWGHIMWLYPRTIVAKWKYIKVCGYSDPFSKTWTKGHWPLDDIWPQDCWGHIMWLYPRTIVAKWKYIKVCGYSDQFCKITTYYIHTYYVHTTFAYRMSDDIVSYWTQFSWDKKGVVRGISFFWDKGLR